MEELLFYIVDKNYIKYLSEFKKHVSYNKDEFGKLWREHNLYPKIVELKRLLADFNFKVIRPKMLEYELLK